MANSHVCSAKPIDHTIKCVECGREWEECCYCAEVEDRTCECCNNGEHTPEWTDASNFNERDVEIDGICQVCECDVRGYFTLESVDEI